MSFCSLPEELIQIILTKLGKNPHYSAQYVLLHVNKFLAKNVMKWFDNFSYRYEPCSVIGKENLLTWACNFKRKDLALIKWAETLNINFEVDCYEGAIKNNNKQLINYLFENKCPTHKNFLGTTMFYNRHELFEYFLEIGKGIVKIKSLDSTHNFNINYDTAPYLIECLAVKGNYNMLKCLLKQSYGGTPFVYQLVILSEDLHNKQKLKIIKLLHKYVPPPNNIILCELAFYHSDTNIVRWMIKNGFEIGSLFFSAIVENDIELVIFILEHNVPIDDEDIEFLKQHLKDPNNMISENDIIYILDLLSNV